MVTMRKKTALKLFSPLTRKGFSLLELMMAIAIMAVMAIYGASALRNWLRIQDINKTVLDLQHLLAVSIKYHNQYGFWPYDIASLEGNAALIEVGAACSPWPYRSSTAVPPDSSSPNYILYAKLSLIAPISACPSKAPYFLENTAMTTTRKPGAYMIAAVAVENATIASEIAAKLPFGTSNGNTVIAFTAANYAPPTEWAWGGDHVGWITGGGLAGQLDPNTQHNSKNGTIQGEIPLPTCPSGFEGHLIVAPQFFMTDYDDYGSGYAEKDNWMVTYPGRELSTQSSQFGTNYVTKFMQTINSHGAITSGNGGVEDPYETFLSTGTFGGYPAFLPQNSNLGQYKQTYYFTFCLPENNWHVYHNGVSSIYSYTAAQCINSGSNWGSYNDTPGC